jgi:tetratricopeptide (TPR) repeat protein
MTTADDYLARGLQLHDQDQLALADACLREGIGRFPEDGRLWQLWGIARWLRADFTTALEALETAHSRVPLSALAQCALADCYLNHGKTAVARTLFRLLAADRHCPLSLTDFVASGLEAVGDYRRALQLFRRLVAHDPGDHRAWFEIASLMSRLGYPNSATVDTLGQAFRLAPDVPAYRLNLAFLQAKLGRLDCAYLLASRVAPVELHHPFWLHKLQDLFHRVGDRKRHEACARRLAELEQTRHVR